MRKSISVISTLAVSMLFSSQLAFAEEAQLPANDILPQTESQDIAQKADIKVIDLLDKTNPGDEGQKSALSQQAAALLPPQLQAANNYNFSPRDFGYSVVQTSDGGYVFTGSTTVNGSDDIIFAKTDAALTLQWAYAYGGTGAESGAEVRATSDGGYMIAGTSNASGSSDVILVKTDASGTVQWSKTYGGPAKEEAQAMELGTDGGYIVVGTKESSSNSNDAYMLKVDANGSIQWTRTFGKDNLEDRFYGVAVTPEGGYVAVGYKTVSEIINPGTAQRMYGLMVKVNGSGNTVFESTLDRYSMLNGVAATSSGYVAAGSINNIDLPNNPQVYNIFVTKVSTSGSQSWSRQFHATNGDFANDVKLAKDGNFIVTGFITPAVYKEDLLMLKIDGAGNTQWSNTYSFGDTGEIGRSVAATSDGGYVVAGSYLSNNDYDVLLLKFGSD
ncbi:hypothetical protein [Paenibacillus jilunlii]|uniref:PQQ-like domain-containing protein n=1 Tax=Paenibacillus jilunlii TaxID=682956 RepID=A0A1G9NMC0_9BACL|nr:hypothetical protein [Paenibacillus jilunlii]KWX77091.1 hypothetical protein AML91_08580 [Paenibacillus jilunlii]SDL87529.1 hypothetical protein SAMN05216191_106250 [Paenibacillus jilunlii]